MRFQVYNDPAAGVLLWDSGAVSIDVDNGLFNVGLAVPVTAFNGQGLWLRIQVNAEWLSPRQALLPVPYALSLKPGAVIDSSSAGGWLLKVQNTANLATGAAVWGEAATSMAVYGRSLNGIGVHGYTNDGYAVSGSDAGTDQARGYGGYFTSQNGVGVYGSSFAERTARNMYAPGVYGRSANGVGVYGVADSATSSGPGGLFQGRVGIAAHSSGTDTQGGYAGRFVSDNYRGLYAQSLSGWYDAYFAGVGGIYSAGGYWSLRTDLTIAVNGGDEALEPGDVVALAGITESPDGGGPLLVVRKADAAHASAVIGVAVQAVRLEMKEVEPGMVEALDVQPVEGKIPPQGHLAIATSGLVAAVKVDVPTGGFQIGDLLAVSPVPGMVRKAEAGIGSEGAILGKAAGPVDVASSTVPVFISLR
jgi:hypothetical protein